MQLLLRLALWCVAFATLAAAQAPGVSTSRDALAQGYKIAGTAVNAATGAPVARANVTLADTRDRMRRISTITGDDGRFEFSGLPQGKYTLQGSRPGYLVTSYEQHGEYSSAIVTGTDFATDNLLLRLMPMALISGHVLDESGEPVRNASIRLFMDDHSGGISHVTSVGGASTDDRGYFDVGVLQPGTYYAAANAKPWYAVHPTESPNGNNPSYVAAGLDMVYPTTYYGGATESDGAAPIELRPGEHRDIDIRLVPVPSLHFFIHFPRVERGRNQQIPNLSKPAFGEMESVPAEIRISSPSMAEVAGVPAGHYEFRMFRRGAGVSDVDQLGEIDLERNGQEVSISQGEALGKLKVTLHTRGDAPMPNQTGVALRDAQENIVDWKVPNSEDQVTFEMLRPGRYHLAVQSSEAQFVVRRILPVGGEPMVGSDVTVAAGGTTELTAELAVGEVRIDGVAQKNGKPIAGVLVALLPADAKASAEQLRRDQSDFDGSFSLRGVVPGDYTVVALENAWGLDWRKPAALAHYVLHGQQVKVSETARGSLTLPAPVDVQEAAPPSH